MLIQVKSSNSFYGSRGSRRMKREDESRYQMRKGMAKVALRSKANGTPELDSRGVPMFYANRMADGHSISTIEKWANGESQKAVMIPDSAYAQGWERIFGKQNA